MILKIWPDGFIASEDKNYGGPELNYGRSDDYFTIDMEEEEYYQAARKIRQHFTGAQREQVIAELQEYYEVQPPILTDLNGNDLPE